MRIPFATFIAASTLLVCANAAERLEPAHGCYFGFTLGSSGMIDALSARLGFTPATYLEFFSFSDSSPDFDRMKAFLDEVTIVQGIATLTLEPHDGLDQVTQKACDRIAALCADAERAGIGGIFIRFAHEMNGNWYAWGQRPTEFKSKFRQLAETIHSQTARTAMVWAPNYGVGYPFGSPIPSAGSTDFALLDTNGDGQITDRDDPYEPYYPGDDAVDWVGMTLYHWGVDFPWLENELPPANSFAGSLLGNYHGSVPNVYARYCGDALRKKPLVIAETAAFYNTQMPGPGELEIKRGWWTQVLNGPAQFPMLKCINWFDELKHESIAENDLIDWRITATPQIRDAFVADLAAKGLGNTFLTANETMRLAPNYIAAKQLPEILPVTGTIRVSLEAKAEAACDLVIDLLDDDFQWQGGTRAPMTAGVHTVTTSFPLAHPLTDMTGYRWSIFLTPTGNDYLSAIAWYHGPNPSDDPDADGAANRDEAIAGTSPRDANDVLTLSIENESGSATISWPSKTGRHYQVFSTWDWTNWTAVTASLPGTGGLLSVPTPNGSGFYRLRVTNP